MMRNLSIRFKFIVFIISIGAFSCQGNDSLLVKIADQNIVECESTGIAGSKGEIYSAFERIKRRSTSDELRAMLNHESDAVAVYAAYALLDREFIRPSELLNVLLARDQEVKTFCGCLMSSQKMSNLLYYRYWNTLVRGRNDKNHSDVTIDDTEELLSMDSLLLYSVDPDRYLIDQALRNRVYPVEYDSIVTKWKLAR